MKNRRLWIGLAILSMTYFSTLHVDAKVRPAKTSPGTAIFVMAELQRESISAKTLIEKKPYMQLQVAIPQIHGITDRHFEKKWNHEHVKLAKKRIKAQTEQINSYQKDLIQDELAPIMFEYTETFEVIPSLKPYYVIASFQYAYTGGAHGATHAEYTVIDTQKGTVVSLKSLFKEQVNYEAVVNESVFAQLEALQKQGVPLFSGTQGFQGISETQNFFINEQGEIVLVFDPCEIAPYSAGIQYIKLPNTWLKLYLK